MLGEELVLLLEAGVGIPVLSKELAFVSVGLSRLGNLN